MDYFSELLESYEKLKKRTYKLTFINEQAGAGEQELLSILNSAPAEEAPISAGAYPGLQRFKYSLSKSEDSGINVTGTLDGQNNVTVAIIKDGKFSEEGSAPAMKDALLKAMAGEEQDLTPGEKADQTIADQAAAREQFLATRAGQFVDQGYSVNPDDKVNINSGMASLQKTQEALDKDCQKWDPNRLGKTRKWCKSQKLFITGSSKASMTWKIANGTSISDPPDEREQHLPAGLVNDALKSNQILLSFITDPPNEDNAQERCAELKNRVGSRGKGRLVLFGEDVDESTGRPSDGIVINVTNNAYLYQGAFSAAEKSCGESFNPTALGSASTNNKALNTIRGTVNEKALQLAVRLNRKNLTPQELKAELRDLASYIMDKQTALRAFAQETLAKGPDPSAQDLGMADEEQILMEQFEMSQSDELIRYTLDVIRKHQEFVRFMGADDSYDYAKGGGTGARADSVLLYKSQEGAIEAAKKAGLDPKKAVTQYTGDDAQRKGMFEIGIGQKDKKDGIGSVKMGEFNSTARRRGVIRGELSDDKIGKNFYKWADQTQFGKGKEGAARKENFLKFEETLESEIADIGSKIRNGIIYNGKDGTTRIAPKEILSMMSKIVTKSLGFKGKTSEDTRELGNSFVGKVDFNDKAEVDKRAELIERKARVKKVSDALNNPETQQAAQDWIIRNAMMTGGNQRDILQLVTSYDENRSVAVNHNKFFDLLNNKDSDISIVPSRSGSSFVITVDGLEGTLGFEGTSTSGGRETRTAFNLSKGSVLDSRMGQGFVTPASSTKTPKEENTLYQFIEKQVKLLESLIQAK
tara:strand:+ start:3832 stop:6267 length:2436 start_codon:yes stop_codon:yes gene_type:complete